MITRRERKLLWGGVAYHHGGTKSSRWELFRSKFVAVLTESLLPFGLLLAEAIAVSEAIAFTTAFSPLF